MRRTNDPSTGQQIAVSAALLVIDLMLIGWSVYAVGMAGWADSYQSDGVAPSSVPEAMSQALWLLGGAAVLTGGGLLAVGWRLAGMVQLTVLGFGAALVSSLAG